MILHNLELLGHHILNIHNKIRRQYQMLVGKHNHELQHYGSALEPLTMVLQRAGHPRPRARGRA